MGIMSRLWRNTAWGSDTDLGNIDADDMYACPHVSTHWQGALVPEEFGRTRSEYLGKPSGSIPFDFMDVQGHANFPENTKISIRELPGLAWYSMRVLDSDGSVLRKDKPGPWLFTLKQMSAKAIQRRVQVLGSHWVMTSDDVLLRKRKTTQVNQFQWLLSVGKGKPSPGKPYKQLVHIFDLLHAGFTGSIDDPVLTARVLLQEPLEDYGMTWQARVVSSENQLSQSVNNMAAPSLWDILCGWEDLQSWASYKISICRLTLAPIVSRCATVQHRSCRSIAKLLLFALELAPSKISPIFCSVTFHLYLTEFLSSRLKSGTIEIL
jgi:hypothetical protein